MGDRSVTASAAGPARREGPGILSVQHAVRVLRTFTAAEPLLGVNEIARRMGMHKSSISRILYTLEQDHLVERDGATGFFRLGPGLIALAAPILAGLNVVEVARTYLEELAMACGETVTLGLWTGSEAVNFEQVLGPGAIKHIALPGGQNPAHCTATGKVFLAALPESDVERILAQPLKRYTEHTILSRSRLMDEISAVRHLGYAVNDAELQPDVVAIAAPVRNLRGEVVAAVAASMPRYRFTPERRSELFRTVTDGALKMSRRLGYSE